PTKAFNGPATLRRLAALGVVGRLAGRISSVEKGSVGCVISQLLANPLRYCNLRAVNDIGLRDTSCWWLRHPEQLTTPDRLHWLRPLSFDRYQEDQCLLTLH